MNISARVALFLALSAPAFAGEAPLWLRTPSISPDASTVAFAYRGDLFRVPSKGGPARALTTYEGTDSHPVWSPDGRLLAFASDRYGNLDVFVMSAQGGLARRLTLHSADDIPYDFSPDGQRVLFGSTRVDDVGSSQFPSGSLPELYSVGIDGTTPSRRELTLPAEDAQWDTEGRRLLYHDRVGYEDPWRKHHRSSVTRDLWLYDTAEERFAQLAKFESEDRNPVFSADGESFFFLSERAGTFNVFRAPLDGSRQAEALTSFAPHPVRFLSAADDDTLAFSYHGELYTLHPGEAPRKIPLQIHVDPGRRELERLSLDDDITEMKVSPNGKEVALVFRGEVFVTSVESAFTRRITDTPTQERSVDFSPDGRSLIYAGERDGSWNLYRTDLARDDEKYFFQATVLGEKGVLVSDRETFQPSFSPTGKEVAYLEDRMTLKVLDLDSGESRLILGPEHFFSYVDGDQHFRWSPDGKWLLVEFLQPGYWISEVGLIAADGEGDLVNLTQSGYYDMTPSWMMDGEMVLWRSNRDGLQGHAKAGPSETDAYGMLLTREAWERFLLTEEEYELLKEEEKKAKAKEGEDEKEEEKKELPKVEVDLDGLRDRMARLTIHSSRLADAVVTPDGEKLVYLASFEKGYDLWVTELRTKATKILTKLGANRAQLELADGGKQVFVLADGKLSKVDLEKGESKAVSVAAEMTLSRAAEREYLFDHVCREVADKFYEEGMHGAPWQELCDDYRPFLAHIGNSRDFAEMLGELLGELNASHTGGRYRPKNEDGDETASLGLLFDGVADENGLRIAEVVRKGPLATGTSKVEVGHRLVSVDGETLGPRSRLARLLNHKAGRYTRLGFRDPVTGRSWEEVVKPLSPREESEILYERWVEQRRRLTLELSGGRLGYVHVRNMSDPSFRTVQEEVLGRHATAEGLVVDTRFNGGGDLVDDLAIFLSGVQYMDFRVPHRGSVGMEPSRRWTKPSIVLASEGNYSDAHCFPWAYQDLGIGKVVGMPVPGTCTFVWWERLQDRELIFGIPIMGIKDRQGRWLENLQLEPDILVEPDPALMIQGRDEQLERAVEELLAELGS